MTRTKVGSSDSRRTESPVREYFGQFSPDRVGESICGFLNADGGQITIGIDSSGRVRGLPNANEVLTRIAHEVLPRILPPASVSVSDQIISDKICVVLDVPPGTELPYAYKDRIFHRADSQVKLAGAEQISELISKSAAMADRWERQVAIGVDEEDLDETVINIAKAEASARSSQPWMSDTRDFLASLGLIEAGLVRNGAVVLFHKQASRILPQTRVRAVAFRTNDVKDLVDNRVFEGHAFALYEQIESFLRRNLPVASILPENGSVRRDALAYPWGALREGVMNALTHRDYAAFDGQLSIQIKPTQIEIWNPGRLPEGMTVKDLPRGNVSRPHNPDIAHVFFLRGLIERVGIGTQRIVQECKAAGLLNPVWELRAGGVSLTLRLPGQAFLRTPVAELNLSSRARRGLNKLNIKTVGKLVHQTANELLKAENFGTTSLTEVREKLALMGLKLRGD